MHLPVARVVDAFRPAAFAAPADRRLAASRGGGYDCTSGSRTGGNAKAGYFFVPFPEQRGFGPRDHFNGQHARFDTVVVSRQ